MEFVNAFAGTASYYRRFRPGIPTDVAALLDQAAPKSSPRRLMDIGTGPGLVVYALLPYFDDLFAVDAEPTMLAEAEAVLRPVLSTDHRLQTRHALAEDFVPPEGWRPHLVTCGRVFHWLDQPRFLDRLSEYVAPDGVVAVFSDRSLWTGNCSWQQAAREVVQEFLGEQRRAGDGFFSPVGPPYEEVLRASDFCDVTSTIVPVHRKWSVDQVIGYLYSTSFAAQHLFGDRLDAFEAALAGALAPFAEGGQLPEGNAFTVLTASRPSARKER
ncbi:class I SAM-dependent methyltransferase [Streptomyces sp. MNU76]|uniref:class I SAM-dependent methyltransferase n=1 Tax=Streptomyces sp. MNU76 TaxID=2560026 RepID=UPI001E4374FB|nr:class I SAM-dependent methyltransferase [Streptomyces sp. MNU76]MCC9707149.1 class I SAM-dependent methyltransferase [Streptomyces sp. MNU76]